MDALLAAITAATEQAKDGLPEVRHHSNMLRFLCHEMEKVERLLPRVPREAPQDVLVLLKDEMERGSRLISRHRRHFDLRGFSKVDLVSRNVEQMCVVFRECLYELGLEEGTIDIETKMNADEVAEDKRYMYWYLTCILDGRGIDRQIPDGTRKELEEQVTKHRLRMEFVTMIPEGEITQREKIGEGGYGQVFKGWWKKAAVAVKMLRSDLTPESRAEFLSEVELHIQLNHPNVVRCFGAVAFNGIVMELALTDLEKFYWRHGEEWDWSMRLHLMLSACSGLQHLHNSRMVHGDIKTAKFLVFDSSSGRDVVIKISDFGLAATKTETRSKTAFPMAGTILWMAPELFDGAPQSFSADVFSFGLVLFELAALSPPYRGLKSNVMVLRSKINGRTPVPLPDNCPEALSRLMKRCIAVAPRDRPTMEQVGAQLTKILQQAMQSRGENNEVAISSKQHCQETRDLSAGLAQQAQMDVEEQMDLEEQWFYEDVMLSPMQADMEISSPIRYKLVFTHDCQVQSCSNSCCRLCMNNPKRPCGGDMYKRKYFEDDLLMARCGGPIKIHWLDIHTNKLVKICMTLELYILDGPSYDQKFPNGIPYCACDGLARCQLLMVEQVEREEREQKIVVPLLQSDYLPNQPNGKLHVRLQDGEATLPNVKVVKSSKPLLGGRRTTFRLYAGVPRDAVLSPESVLPAVDPNGFVVAARRAQLQEKNARPFLDDPIASLEQISSGRAETLGCLGEKKLELPHGTPGKVHVVRDFLRLGYMIQGHPQQKKEVLKLLEMNEVQWIEAWNHAQTAVKKDNQMRVWWFHASGLKTGLLYECEAGEVKLKHPVALIHVEEDKPHVTPAKDLPQGQQEYVDNLHMMATENYTKPGHPDWEVCPFDSIDLKEGTATTTESTKLIGMTGASTSASTPVTTTVPASQPRVGSEGHLEAVSQVSGAMDQSQASYMHAPCDANHPALGTVPKSPSDARGEARLDTGPPSNSANEETEMTQVERMQHLRNLTERASQRLEKAMYNKSMLSFLRDWMEHAYQACQQQMKAQATLGLENLTKAVESGENLIRKHASFDLSTYYSVAEAKGLIKDICCDVQDELKQLGLEHGKDTTLPDGCVMSDRNFIDQHIKFVVGTINEDDAGDLRFSADWNGVKVKLDADLEGIVPIEDREIDWDNMGRIGSGGEGVVYESKWNGKPVAIKQLKRHEDDPESYWHDQIAKFWAEIALNASVASDHVAHVKAFNADNHYFVMEKAGENLEQWCKGQPTKDWATNNYVLWQASMGLCDLHKQNVTHCDVKPSNFLVYPGKQSGFPVIKICDFGIAFGQSESFRRKTTRRQQRGTLLYKAPELFNGKRHTSESDVYSFALVMLSVLTRTQLYARARTDERVMAMKLEGEEPCDIPPGCVGDLIRRCLRLTASKRPTMREVVEALCKDSSSKAVG